MMRAVVALALALALVPAWRGGFGRSRRGERMPTDRSTT